jgi:pilus assembly protein Flp/PilA
LLWNGPEPGSQWLQTCLVPGLRRTRQMPVSILKLYVRIQTLGIDLRRLIAEESGQDLIEYALVVALIAFAAAAGMTTVATKINTAFTNIGTKLTTYTS